MVLSSKVKDQEMIVLDELKIEKPKTKEIIEVIQTPAFAFFSDKSIKDKAMASKAKAKNQKSVLVALSEKNKDIVRAAKNIPKVKTIQVKDLNVLDLLNYKYLMMPKKGIDVIKETFSSVIPA